jgi:dienelactone hydrolase
VPRLPVTAALVVTAVVLLTVAAGVGVPYGAKAGPSVGGVVGGVAFAVAVGVLVAAWRRGRAARRVTRVASVLATIVLLAVSLMTLGQALAASWVPRTEVGRRPADLGLSADDVRLHTSDGVALAAWYVPPRNGAAVVVAHGAGSTRSSVLDHATVLVDHGYGILALDARGHGESDGRAMDLGWWGDEDIGAAVDFLAERPEVDHIAAVGLSMGGEEVVGAAAADDRIEAVVAEGATVRVAGDRAWLSDAYGWRGSAQELLEHATTWFADRLSPADPPRTLREAVRASSPRPVLLLTAGEEPDEDRAAAWIASGSPASVTVVGFPGAGHTDGLRTDPRRWERAVIGFLDDALGV